MKTRGLSMAPEEVSPAVLLEPMYVYLCSGEVIMVAEVEGLELGQLALKLLCPDCTEVVFPRQGIYMCSRLKDVPPSPD
jgi:hypothetical protein